MIPAFIVLLVIACGLGGFIAFDAVRDKIAKNGGSPKYKAADSAPQSELSVLPEDYKDGDISVSEREEIETDEDDGKETKIRRITENGKTRFIIVRYSKSFTAKLIQSEDRTKDYYSKIKNCLLSYGGVKSNTSWKWESFRRGRKTLAKIRLRGKTLSVCLALDPHTYENTKYHVEDISDVKAYADTPCLYRIKNDRRAKYIEQLIADLMAGNGLIREEREQVDYVSEYPYDTTESLIERKLIKELIDEETIKEIAAAQTAAEKSNDDEDAQSGTEFNPSRIMSSVTAHEADELLQDDVAESLVESEDGVSDRTRQGIINIDTLSKTFASGERVTLEEVKKRVKGFDSRTTYLKILARGTLDKPLIVEADSFSLQAVKMIVLTGGKAVRKQ